MKKISDVVEKIKELVDCKSDSEVASALKMSDTALYNHKSRETIPYKNIIAFCEKDRISLDWLLTGEGSKHREESERHPLRPPGGAKEEAHGATTAGGERVSLPIYRKMEAHQLTPEGQRKIEEEGYSVVPYRDVEASAGGGAFVDDERITDYFVFHTWWLRRVMGLNPKQASLITVVGDSMEPSLRQGDLLLIDHNQNQVIRDSIYILRMDGLLLAKRLQRMIDGTVLIRSDNPAYKEQAIPKESTPDLHIIGRAVWVGRKI